MFIVSVYGSETPEIMDDQPHSDVAINNSQLVDGIKNSRFNFIDAFLQYTFHTWIHSSEADKEVRFLKHVVPFQCSFRFTACEFTEKSMKTWINILNWL